MKKVLLIVIFLAIISIVVVGAVYYWQNRKEVEADKDAPAPSASRDARFGFLSGPPGDDYKKFADTDADFIRPHPEPFIWGGMQERKDSEIDFGDSDALVKEAQKYDLNVLATLMPYAEWDQIERKDKESCKVKDEFSGYGKSKLLGQYRCSPHDWAAYEEWVKAVVERYDGDGTKDMPGLTTPTKYWEVNNEPDLKPPPGEEEGLRFYVGGPSGYGQLLKKTYLAIKEADSQAKVLIAGAAGGNDEFLDFYRELFADKEVKDYFDIANVHCISNDDYQSFNVEPYKKMLAEFQIDKPIWVTEAEAFISADPDMNAAQVKASTVKALELGAEKIFYTSLNFEISPGKPGPGGLGPEYPTDELVERDPLLDGDKPIEAFKRIFQSASTD